MPVGAASCAPTMRLENRATAGQTRKRAYEPLIGGGRERKAQHVIRIGIIGASGRGCMATHWHDPKGRSVVVAAADPAPAALDWFKANVNAVAFVTPDYGELLARDDVHAVAVMSPDYTHAQYVCDAFAAGKHVFAEKPMAITTEGCDRMLRAWVHSASSGDPGCARRHSGPGVLRHAYSRPGLSVGYHHRGIVPWRVS